MPRSTSPFRQRSLSQVAKRVGLREHELRRAAARGNVKTRTWNGVDWVEAQEEARLKALVDEARTPIPDASTKTPAA